jgi:lipopolysaccharide transport protein LptA
VDDLDTKTPPGKAVPAKTTPAKPGATSKPAKTSNTTKSAKTPKGGQAPAKTSTKSTSKSGPDAAEEIHYWSNGLQLQKEAGIADLEDNVVVTKGDMRLESKKARIYFKADTSEIIRVVATGDVRMQKHDPSLNKTIRAQGEEAVFYNMEQRVTVRGNARLWRGSDLMKGKQIDYDMGTGIVKVQQVEGVVQPANKE